MRSLSTITVLAVVGFVGFPAQADTSNVGRDADAAYEQRENPEQAQRALRLYEKAMTDEPSHAEWFWKASRAAWWVGSHDTNRSNRLRDFQKGMTYAQAGTKIDPNAVEAHFWLAASEGSYGENKGVMKSLSLIKPIRLELAEVIRLNDRYLDGGAYRALGVVDYKVPSLAGGNRSRALEELQKSLAMNPDNPFAHYYLADYYRVVGDQKHMHDELQILQSLTVPREYLPELHYLQKRAQTLEHR